MEYCYSTTSHDDDNLSDEEDDTITITARCVINAAGIDCDVVQSSAAKSGESNSSILPQPTFEARPRRGQYAIFAAPNEGDDNNAIDNVDDAKTPHSTTWPNVPRTIPIRPIQPNPTQFTKGIFVYSTLYDQIVVGLTATDQTSRIDNKIDQKVATELVSHAKRVLGPQFDDTKLIGDYVGIRPGTNQRDYQIHLHHGAQFITVGGIRSTGLTASLGIGRHVVQCLLPSIFRGLLLLMMKVSYWLLLHHYQM